jgi:hypothetical protein
MDRPEQGLLRISRILDETVLSENERNGFKWKWTKPKVKREQMLGTSRISLASQEGSKK